MMFFLYSFCAGMLFCITVGPLIETRDDRK
jgi:hypothetical protein